MKNIDKVREEMGTEADGEKSCSDSLATVSSGPPLGGASATAGSISPNNTHSGTQVWAHPRAGSEGGLGARCGCKREALVGAHGRRVKRGALCFLAVVLEAS